jgi:hypothetical protein
VVVDDVHVAVQVRVEARGKTQLVSQAEMPFGSTALSVFGLETSLSYGTGVYPPIAGLVPSTGSPAAGRSWTRSVRYRYAGMMPRRSELSRSKAAS